MTHIAENAETKHETTNHQTLVGFFFFFGGGGGGRVPEGAAVRKDECAVFFCCLSACIFFLAIITLRCSRCQEVVELNARGEKRIDIKESVLRKSLVMYAYI